MNEKVNWICYARLEDKHNFDSFKIAHTAQDVGRYFSVWKQLRKDY